MTQFKNNSLRLINSQRLPERNINAAVWRIFQPVNVGVILLFKAI